MRVRNQRTKKTYFTRQIERWQNKKSVVWIALSCLAIGFLAGTVNNLKTLSSLVPKHPSHSINIVLHPYTMGWRYSEESGVDWRVGGGPLGYFEEFIPGIDGTSVSYRIWLCGDPVVVNASVSYDPGESNAPVAVINEIIAVVEPTVLPKHGHFVFGTANGAASDIPGIVEGTIEHQNGEYPLRYWGEGEAGLERMLRTSPPGKYLYLKPHDPIFLEVVLNADFDDYQAAYIRLGLILTVKGGEVKVLSANRLKYIHKEIPDTLGDAFCDHGWSWIPGANVSTLKLAYID